MDNDMNVVEDVEGMRLDLHRLQVDMRDIELMVQRVSKLITQLLDTLYRYQPKLEPGTASRHDDSAVDEIDSLGFPPPMHKRSNNRALESLFARHWKRQHENVQDCRRQAAEDCVKVRSTLYRGEG